MIGGKNAIHFSQRRTTHSLVSLGLLRPLLPFDDVPVHNGVSVSPLLIRHWHGNRGIAYGLQEWRKHICDVNSTGLICMRKD